MNDGILQQRLANQHLAQPRLSDPGQLVGELGAVQAQDYPAAKWALAQRLHGVTHEQLERAFAAGEILRTHVLRPTWHFVAPTDIRWMLALTAPRIKAAVATYTRQLGLDHAFLRKCASVFERALEGGKSLTRAELGAAMREAGLEVRDGATLGNAIFHAELDALVCSGVRRGGQQTYALLEERVPAACALERDEALAELTWRYFSSHGPALVHDCSWWSGLPVAQITRGVHLNASRLRSETIDGRTYWLRDAPAPAKSEVVYLLPNYDEYTVAYRARDLYYDAELNYTGDPRQDIPFTNVIVVRGHVVGRWTRAIQKQAMTIDACWSMAPSDEEQAALRAAAERYAVFLNLPLTLREEVRGRSPKPAPGRRGQQPPQSPAR